MAVSPDYTSTRQAEAERDLADSWCIAVGEFISHNFGSVKES